MRVGGAGLEFGQGQGLAAGEREEIDLRLLLFRAAHEGNAVARRRPDRAGIAGGAEAQLAGRGLAVDGGEPELRAVDPVVLRVRLGFDGTDNVDHPFAVGGEGGRLQLLNGKQVGGRDERGDGGLGAATRAGVNQTQHNQEQGKAWHKLGIV